MKTFKLLSLLLLTAAPALAQSNPVCVRLNGFARYEDLPNVLCGRFSDSGRSPNVKNVQIVLYRNGVVLDQVNGEALYVAPHSVCNRHTGDCRMTAPIFRARLDHPGYSVDVYTGLRLNTLSGSIVTKKYNYTQYSMEQVTP